MREYVTKLLSERYDVTTASNGTAFAWKRWPWCSRSPSTSYLHPPPTTHAHTPSQPPVALLSAQFSEESKVEGLEAGADDYLIKPFTARELLARVGSHLDMVRMRSEAARREQELRFQVNEAKERLERIISSIQDAFVSLDRDLRYAFANDNAALIAGAKKEDMLGRDVWDFMADTEDKVVRNNLERAIREQIDVCFEFYYPAKDR
ncbi:multi-sensor hybrid histidine kinase, partial [Acanthamoeba castellanii str. Neff]